MHGRLNVGKCTAFLPGKLVVNYTDTSNFESFSSGHIELFCSTFGRVFATGCDFFCLLFILFYLSIQFTFQQWFFIIFFSRLPINFLQSFTNLFLLLFHFRWEFFKERNKTDNKYLFLDTLGAWSFQRCCYQEFPVFWDSEFIRNFCLASTPVDIFSRE